jgi:hypothetical protein
MKNLSIQTEHFTLDGLAQQKYKRICDPETKKAPCGTFVFCF